MGTRAEETRGGMGAAILALDELVHESMEHAGGAPGECSREASRIDNGGLSGQVRHVLEGWGREGGEALVRGRLGLA